MKNLRRFLLLFLVPLGIYSCAELMAVAEEMQTSESQPLSSETVASGLKKALEVGTDTAVSRLAQINGYWKDPAVRIPLPDEADVIVENISKIPGGEQLIDDALLLINRAAEDAAKEAAPVFVSAIRSMTIADAMGILKGADNAATNYLERKTRDQLFNLYQPRIKRSVDKDLLGNLSTAEVWDQLTGKWNNFAGSTVGRLAGYETVNVDLDAYLTNRALDGLFLKIANEEKDIRKDPAARVTDLLRKVFG